MSDELNFLSHSLNSVAARECVFHSVTCDVTSSLPYLGDVEKERITPFIEEIYQNIQRSKETLDVRWSIRNLLSFFKDNIQDMAGEIALIDFLENKELSKQIAPLLGNNGKLSDKIAHDLCFLILVLRNTNPGIYFTILPELTPLINNIPIQKLHHNIGPDAIVFYENPPIHFFSQLSDFDHKEIPNYFLYSMGLKNNDLTYALQKNFVSFMRYPGTIEELTNAPLLALTNTCINENIGFIDFLAPAVADTLISADTDMFDEMLELIPDIKPYFLIINQPMLYSDMEAFIELFSSDYKPSIATDVIKRFHNDYDLVQLLSIITSNDFCTGDLMTNSIPFHIQYNFEKSDEFLNSAPDGFFSITDEAFNNDCDFLRSWKIFKLFLGCLAKPPKGLSYVIQQIETALAAFTNSVRLSLVVIELFSCIFIRQNNGYICHPLVAMKLIETLAKFESSSFIQGASNLFSQHRAKRTDTTLDPYFERDHNVIFKAIDEKNWPLAEKLTQFIPYYRRFFMKARSAYNLINEGKENDEINFEVALSTFGSHDLLKKEQDKYPQYQSMIQYRLKTTGDSVLNPLPIPERWEPATHFVENFENSSLEIIASGQINVYIVTFNNSEQLYKFVNYLKLYYDCASLFNAADYGSMEEIFRFDIKKALAGPFNIGDFQKSQKLAKMAGIDLVPFVINHLDVFNVQSDYLKLIFDLYPLEASALAYTIQDVSLFDEKPDKYKGIKQLIENETEEKQQILDYKTLMYCEEDEIDDYIYRIDPTIIYREVMKINEGDLLTKHFKMLDIISYVAPEQDKPKLQRITIYHRIRKITHASKPDDIINDLIARDDFELALNYLHFCVRSETLAMPLCKLFYLSINDGKRMDRILSEFSGRYNTIASRYFHIPGVLPHLIKFSPPEKKEFFEGISQLPEEVFLDSNIFEVDTIAASFVRHPEAVFMLTNKIRSILTDQHLLTIIKNTKNGPYFQRIVAHLYNIFQDKSLVLDYWFESAKVAIKQINVNSEEAERRVNVFFRQIRKVLFEVNDIECQQILCLSEFGLSLPFTHCGVSYDCSNFEAPEFPHYLLHLCHLCDEEEIAISISKAYSIKLKQYYFERAYIQMQIGQYKKAEETLKRHNLMIDESSPDSIFDSSFKFLTPIAKKNIFKYNVSLQQQEPFSPYSLIKSTKQPCPNKDELQKLLINYTNPKAAISFMISYKEYQKAYGILISIPDVENQIDAFIRYFFFAFTFNNDLAQMEELIKMMDQDFELTGHLFDGIVKFFERSNLSNGLLQIYLIREQYNEAAKTALDLLSTATSLSIRISLLGHAIRCINQLGSSSDKDILRLKKRIEIQYFFYQKCVENGIELNNESYDLIHDDNQAANVCAVLMLNKSTPLIDEILSIIEVNMKSVSEKICKILCYEKLQFIVSFIQDLSHSNQQLLRYIRPEILKALSQTNNRQYILSLIMLCYSTYEEQCLLFIEYDFLVEAFAHARSEKSLLKHLPLIAYRASTTGNKEIVNNCVQMLATMK